jgi:hypothetical protein
LNSLSTFFVDTNLNFMHKHLSLLSLLVLLFVGLSGCGGSSATQQLETPELQLSAEGPLYSGANSSTATWEFDLAEILGDGEKQISEARITSVEVLVIGADSIPSMEKMVFEVTSKNTPMTRIGLYEGGISKGQPFSLTIAEEQENLAAAFADGKMTFVGDFDLLDEEYMGNIAFTLKVKFELGIK